MRRRPIVSPACQMTPPAVIPVGMDRRALLASSVAAAAGMLAHPQRSPAASTASRPQPVIPRWRGFNLLEPANGKACRETDFQWIAGWGFNFVRLPCSYRTWSSKDNWMTINQSALAPLDNAVELGRKHTIHINLCLHRIPGYCVNGSEREPYRLFDSPRHAMERALEAAVYHWRYLAQRYHDVPTAELSFDLLNEPPVMADQSRYVEIAQTLIAAIRDVTPARLIFADGADLGQTPVLGLADQGIVQSTRGYLPKMVSHYQAGWVPPDEFESSARPSWPMVDRHGVLWNRDKLRRELIATWRPLATRGVPIHVGEWGCYDKTPHDVCLAWMRDLLTLWNEAGWGWAMWNLRGSFGIVDSARPDVDYVDFAGHRLDRKMLDLLAAN